MKSLIGVLCLLIVASANARPHTLAIRNVTVIDVRAGSLRAEHTVLVVGNRIAAVGPVREIAVPDDAEIVEAAGRYLIPGLWDMHVHSVANVAVHKSNEAVAARDWHFPLLLAHGVTGVRNMNDGTADLTLELSRSIKCRLAEGTLRGPPRFLAAGPSLDGDPPLGSKPVVVRVLADEARMRFVPAEIRRNWRNMLDSEVTREFQSILRPIVPLELENIRLLNEAGVTRTDLDELLGAVER